MTAPFPTLTGREPCRQDPDLWFPPVGGTGSAGSKLAKMLCRSCPIVAECLAYALDHPEVLGIWGGASNRERDVLRGRRTRPMWPTPHVRELSTEPHAVARRARQAEYRARKRAEESA